MRSLKIVLLVLLALFASGCDGSSDSPDFQESFQNFDAPVRLAFLNNPARVSGTNFTPIQVGIFDHKGFIVPTADNPITIMLVNPNGATLSGTTTRNAVDGVAVFDDLSVDLVGNYAFMATSPGLLSAESTDFPITPADAAALTFLVQPSDVDSGQVIAPDVEVEVRDAQGNLVETQVTLMLDPPGTLGGTTSRMSLGGVAVFDDLTVTGGGVFNLVATVDTGAMAQSDPFTVTGASRVLLIPGNVNPLWVTDVDTKLEATGSFDVVDIFDATNATPTMLDLQNYDAVLTWTDSGGYDDPAALGNVLADFFDGGGRVVTAVFANASIPIGGRFVTDGYLLIDPTGQTEPMAALGNILEPMSPLMNGVTMFAAENSYSSTGGPINGGIVVAEWDDGRPLVVRGTVMGRNRVDLNFFPPSFDARADFWSGDGAELMRNALLFQ